MSLQSVPAPLGREELAFGLPASIQGIFRGFRYRPGKHPDEHYLTAQALIPPEIHNADGDFIFYASCHVEDSTLEFPHEMRAKQIERTLTIINTQLPISAEASFQRLHSLVRGQVAADVSLQGQLCRLSLQADLLGAHDGIKHNPQLRDAVLDLLMEELRLPRLVSVHSEPTDFDAFDIALPHGDRSKQCLEAVRPHLVFRYFGPLARLCFATIHQDRAVSVPIRSVTRVVEYER